jgi:hypothetical protein
LRMSFLFCAMDLFELFAGWRRVHNAQPDSEINSSRALSRQLSSTRTTPYP